jgi:REP-associated tyrosine transposase
VASALISWLPPLGGRFRHRLCVPVRVSHPYPPHWSRFSYIGRHRYSLTFVTDTRRSLFVEADIVAHVLAQLLRAAIEKHFEVIAYCFMPDHLHLIVEGKTDGANCKAFIKAAKQYSGYGYSQAHGGGRLWERYAHDRVIRDDGELAMTLRYVVANPVRAALVAHPRDYFFLGSQRWSVDELLQWCEYSEAVL